MPKLLLIVAATTIVTITVACSGSNSGETPTGSPILCGTDPLPPCSPFGQPVSLNIQTAPAPDFPPLPDTRAAAFPGETVNVTVAGFRPGEDAQVISTDDRYLGVEYRADSEGVVEFSVPIGSSATPGQSYFIVTQDPAEGEDEPLVGSFAIVTLDHDIASDLQGSLFDAVLPGSGNERD